MGCRFYHIPRSPWLPNKFCLLMLIIGANLILTEGFARLRSDSVLHSRGHRSIETNRHIPPRTDKVSRVLPLRSLCTDGYITFSGKKILTRYRKRPQRNNYITMRSSRLGIVTLQSSATEEYLCFNKRGKITTRAKLNEKWCSFRERYNSTYHSFYYQLDSQPLWYLGFRNNGKKLPGKLSLDQRFELCIQFRKPSFEDTPSPSNGNQDYRPPVDFSHLIPDLTDSRKTRRHRGSRVQTRGYSGHHGHRANPNADAAPQVNFEKLYPHFSKTAREETKVQTGELT